MLKEAVLDFFATFFNTDFDFSIFNVFCICFTLVLIYGIIYVLTGIFYHLITRKFFKSQMCVSDISDCQFEPVYTDDIDASVKDKEN